MYVIYLRRRSVRLNDNGAEMIRAAGRADGVVKRVRVGGSSTWPNSAFSPRPIRGDSP